MNSIFLEGMALQASLIFALGPQNIYVLESGLRKHHHLTVSIVCFLCDLTLIMTGVAGAASLFTSLPKIKIIVGVSGVIFLVLYGMGKINAAQTSIGELLTHPPVKRRKAIIDSISFSILNPHAYLDGIILIGGYSSKYSDIQERLTLGLGAASFSLIWFLLLSNGAGLLLPMFRSPIRMKWIMNTAGALLIILSLKLGADVYSWIGEAYPDTMAILSFTRK